MRYNPFAWHVVEYPNNTYAVRKLTVWGWAHLDRDGDGLHWYGKVYVNRWATLPTLDKAIQLCVTAGKPKVVFQ